MQKSHCGSDQDQDGGEWVKVGAGLLDWRWLSTTVLHRAARYPLFQVSGFLKASSNAPKAPALISDKSRVPDILDNSNSISILSSTILDSTSHTTAAACRTAKLKPS